MRVEIDADICGGFGTCVTKAPRVFELTDDGLRDRAPPRGARRARSRGAGSGRPLSHARAITRLVSDAIEPFRDRRRRRGARRPARPARAHPLPRPDRRAPAGSTASRSTTCASSSSTGATSTTGAPQEARLNELDQFRTEIDGQSIHFVHARSPHADALPLLLMHGWPGSIVEFLDVIPPLTDPDAHGGAPPTRSTWSRRRCPGYGFSGPPRTPGWDIAPRRRGVRRADGAPRLRALRRAGRRLGRAGRHPDRRARPGALRRHPPQHADRRPARRGPAELTDEEQADLAAMARFQRDGAGYAQIQATQAADARRRRSTTRRPACWRGSSRSSAPGATATATSSAPSPATSCSPT